MKNIEIASSSDSVEAIASHNRSAFWRRATIVRSFSVALNRARSQLNWRSLLAAKSRRSRS